MPGQSDGYDTTKKQRDETRRIGPRNGAERWAGLSFWRLNTGSSMLHQRDCALTIDRKHPAALNLIHKAPVPIITGCQSVTIECDSCGMMRCTKKVGRINIYQLFDN